MVFESIVADVLNRFLGDYVENLDQSQLKIGIWGGDVVLENLRLKQSALDELSLPVKTTYGHLGKLVLKIPWKNLYSAPVIASVERLFLLVVPNQEVKYDAAKEEKWQNEAKQQQLQKVEDAKKRELEKDKPKADDSFVEKLATQIIKNVQIKIQDIHIRYEDKLTTVGRPFALGITLHHLSVHTTDEFWKEAIIQDTVSQIYKVLSMEGLAVYWNPNTSLFKGTTGDSTEILNEFKSTVCSNDHRPSSFSYILGPINSSVKLQLNPKPELNNYQIPKAHLIVELQKLALGLSKAQYHDVIGLIESLDRMNRGAPYRKYRPNVNSYKGHYKEWWKFAYTCVLEENVRRVRNNWNWDHMLKHAVTGRRYATIYQTKLTSKKLSAELTKEIESLEKALDVFNIVLIRERVEVEVERLGRKISEQKKDAGWFGGWWGGSSKSDESLAPSDIVKKFESAMTPEEKRKLFRAIDYQENDTPADYSEEFIDMKVIFNLSALEIEIRDDVYTVPRVLHAKLSGVTSQIEQRPAAKGLKVIATIQQFTVYGLQQGDFTPMLAVSKDVVEGVNLLDVLFETNPLDKHCDQRVHISSRPLQVTYDARTINKVIDVFKAQIDTNALNQLQAVAESQLQNFREMSATGLQYAIEQHSVLDLNVDLMSSVILIPHGGMYTGSEELVAINLGRFTMSSLTRDLSIPNVRTLHSQGTSEDDIMKSMMSQSYDKFVLNLKDMQVLMAFKGEDWRHTLEDNKVTRLHLLQPMSLVVNVSKCLIQDDPRLPKIKVFAHLPNVTVSLTDERLLHMVSLALSIPRPGDDEMEIGNIGLGGADGGSRGSSQSLASRCLELPLELMKLKETKYKKQWEKKEKLIQAIELDLKFEMNDLTVNVYQIQRSSLNELTTQAVESKLMTFRVMMLELDLIQQTYDMDVTARLGGISLDMFDLVGEVRILDTPMAAGAREYLFTVTYINVDRKSPDFHVKHESTLQKLKVQFTTFSVLLQQEALLSLMEFMQTFQLKLVDAQQSRPVDHFVTQASTRTIVQKSVLSSIVEEEGSALLPKFTSQKMKRRKKEWVDITEFKLEAVLQNFRIRIATRRTSVADVAIEGCSAQVMVKKLYTEIATNLKSIMIMDLNPQTSHTKIMSIVGEEALSAQVIKYDPAHQLYFEENNPDLLVKASIARIQVIYLSWFVSSLLRFTNSFQAAQEKILEAAAGAATAAKQNMQEVVSKAMKISLNIDLQAPIFIIPINSRSMDAIMLDFGYLTVSNTFQEITVCDNEGNPAILDEIELGLQKVKVTRVKLDNQYKVINETIILQPVSFTLKVNHNLSASWHTTMPEFDVTGRLKMLGITLTEEDYKMVMRILVENLSEAYVMDPDADKNKAEEWLESRTSLSAAAPRPVMLEGLEPSITAQVMESEAKPTASPKKEIMMLKFAFIVDSIIIDLFNGGVKTLDDVSQEHSKTGLARFSLNFMSLRGEIMSNSSIGVRFLLLDCLLDDTREGGSDKLTRLMERKDDPDVTPSTSFAIMDSSLDDELPQKSMIGCNFKQRYSETFVDVRVFGFYLILSLEHLLKVAEFFTSHTKKDETQDDIKVDALVPVSTSNYSVKTKNSSTAKNSSTSVKPTSKPAAQTVVEEMSLILNLKIEKPDIILVESMDNINTNATVMNNEVTMKFRMTGPKQVLNGTLQDLQLYSCCYNPAKRKETMALILHPCTLSVVGSTPDGGGMHIDIHLTDIRLGVSPGTIELLNKVYTAVYGSVVAPPKVTAADVNYSEIWQTKKFADTDFWFLKTEEGQDAMLDLKPITEPKAVLSEICMLAAPSVILTLEAGVGRQTLPMILLEAKLAVQARDWSSQLFIESTMSLQMAYYNSRLALWEPLIEPVESVIDGKIIHCPWELKAVVQMRNQDALSSSVSPSDADLEEVVFQPPAMSIDVCSKDNLEVTVTKTSLEVFSMLGKAFQTAVTSGLGIAAGMVAPYLVQNHTGLSVTVMLEQGSFKLLEGESYNEVVLNSGAQVGLCLRNNDEDTTCKHVLGRTDSKVSIENQGQINERFLRIVVKVSTNSCELQLPLVRADKRYFSLKHRGEGNDPWGLVSDVKVVDGGTIVTLRSILQVYNHFSEPVDVYYMTKRGNELECIGTVQPEMEINLPLFSIYTPTNELFFSVKGYTVSVTPFVWKDLKNMLTTMKLLQCNSKNPEEKEPFIMQVVGDTEQVYFENTSRHPMDSTVYNIHLRPAVVLKNLLPLNVMVCLRGLPLERVVKAGERVQLPTAEPGASKLVARIPDYLEKEWSCERDILWNMPPFTVWTFTSFDSAQKLTLDLGMHTEHKNGTLMMSLYCPFWMLNKTGMMLSYRKSRKSERSEPTGSPIKQWDETANILYHPENFKGPVLFSFRAKSFFGKKKAAIKLEDGDWSDKFSLDVAGSSGVVNCKYDGSTYQIGVHIQLTYSTLTKQVTFTPYHVLINNSRVSIECQESDRPADPWTKVEPGACTPLWPRSSEAQKELRLRVLGTTQVSAPFSYYSVHTTLLKLDNKYGGVNVDVQITEGAVYISFSSYEPGLAPALLLNHTDMAIQFWEKEMETYIRTLNPREMIMFTWQKPTGPRSIVWNTGKKKELSDGLRQDGIGEFQPEPGKKVYWVSFLDGIQRVFLFTLDMNVARDAQSAGELEALDREITVAIHGMGMSLVNNNLHTEVMYIGIASSGIIWETRKTTGKRFKPLCIKDCELIEEAFNRYQAELALGRKQPKSRILLAPNLEVDFEMGELLQPSTRHLRRTYQTGVWLQIKSSPHQMQLHAKINRVQIDNQMYDSVFPVVLAPVPPPRSVAASQALKPFAELSVVRRIMEHSPVQQYKYFKILIQEFHVKVDIGFINALVTLFEAEEISDQEEIARFAEDKKLVDEPLLAHVSLLSSQEQKNFYDLLHFSPLKIHLSFSLSAGGGSGAQKTGQETPHFLNILLQSLGVTLTDVQDVVFKLAYFERQYTFLTQRQLIAEARMHYVGQSLKQLYVLVLGLDVIGNPYGLVLGLTQGVEDLFYEPFQGAIQGPGEFAEGLVLGVRSLFGHTVGGAAGAVSRITGAMGKGIAALTFDKDYQRKRREVMNQRPATAQAGLAQSSKGLVMGVVDGVSGVFMKPISGAREEGVEGFFKGVGKGMVGLVTRPTAGVIDFASGSLDAVKRVTEMSQEITRLRPPRYFHQDGLVRPYVQSEAEGNKLLQDLDKGRYVTTDVYEFHLPHVNGTKDVLLLTDKRIMYIEHTDMFGYSLAWQYTWDSMKVPPRVDTRGIFITTSENKKKVLGLFTTGENGKLIIIKNPDQRNLVARKIEKLMKN